MPESEPAFNGAFPSRIRHLIPQSNRVFNASMSCLGRRLGILLAIVFASEVSVARSLSQWLELPPAFQALFGDPEVIHKPYHKGGSQVRLSGVGDYRPFFGIQQSPFPQKLIVRGFESDAELQRVLAESYSRRFFREMLDSENLSRYERRMKMGELIELSEDEFVALSKRMLTGGSAGAPYLDAWWTVRMGLPQTPDREHHLLVTIIHTGKEAERRIESMGHISLGLRHRSGQANRDFIVDFRAPWELDRPPTPLEGFNFGNSLKLAGFSENLYDWLYTQTAHRGCYVKVWALPISREQTTILRHFDERIRVHEGGNFRALRKNCASLALLFYDRIQPVHQALAASPTVADLPLPNALRIVSEYDDVPFASLSNVTEECGREPTAKSEIHRAVPTRASSQVFQKLRRELATGR